MKHIKTVCIVVTEVFVAILISSILSPSIYSSEWFATLANSKAIDYLIHLFHADAYENQTLLIDIMSLIISFAFVLTSILLVHLSIIKCFRPSKQLPQ